MSSHLFLSESWIEAARALHAEYEERLPRPPVAARVNLVITEVPHGVDSRLHAHIETERHGLLPQLGHLDEAELTVTVDYDTARALLLGGEPEAVGQAFFAGRIAVEGDLTRIFALQLPVDDTHVGLAVELNARILAFTV